MSHEWLMRECYNLSRHVLHTRVAHPDALLMYLIAGGLLSIQRSWPIISANNVEHWRTLVKIRCIIQVMVLFSFPALTQATPPPGGFQD